MEKWVAELSAKGLAPATVRNTYVALNKVFRYALRHNHVTRNPCTGTPLPRTVRKFESRFLTPYEVEALAAELDAYPPYGLLVRLAVYTGLRAAEIAGLQVRDLDLMRRRLTVRRTVQRVEGGWLVGAPKSDKSRRTVPLRGDLAAALAAYMALHPAPHDREAALWPGRVRGGGVRSKSALDYGRAFDHQSFYRYYFRPAAARVGLDGVRFHDLRHTYASIMAALGVDVFKVSRWMGHANVSTTTSIYTHLFEDDFADDMTRVDAYVGGRRMVRGA